MVRRIWIFLVIFSILNLCFIPLLSLYGLRVCPVLSIPGFGFGCYYSSAFVIIVNIFNILMVSALKKEEPAPHPKLKWLTERPLLAASLAYVFSTTVALIVLHALLNMNHLTTSSRAPQILALASLLLGLLQGYGLNWANKAKTSLKIASSEKSFTSLWKEHVLRTMLPLAVVAAVLLHFLISQSVQFNEGATAPLVSNDDLIQQTSYLIFFLLAWLCLVFSFHFLSEKDHAQSVQTQIERLKNLDFSLQPPGISTWGLWTALSQQLNAFAKALAERTRLIKSFSRFVTAGVAEQALHLELKQGKGITKELTVIMTDIRNFTSISEKLSPDQVVLLLNEYFTTMLDVISSFNVTVDKFIGDGMLAYVDLESSKGDSTAENRSAVEAAIAMIEKLKILNPRLLGLNLPAIQIGVGIYRGPLVIGLIGSDSKLQHTIIGDAVNRTARLEGLCKELGVSIVISKNIWLTLDGSIQNRFRAFGNQSMKGISESIEIFGWSEKLGSSRD